jgi:hypothetical protein
MTILLDQDRQEPLIERPHIQTSRGLDWGGNAKGWTEIGGRLGATAGVRDGRRDWPGL